LNQEVILAEESVSQEQETIDDLKKALAEAEEKANAYLADAQRERADYQNLKKRTEQEKQEYQSWANAETMRQLLPVVDDMQRAFNMVDPKFKDSTWSRASGSSSVICRTSCVRMAAPKSSVWARRSILNFMRPSPMRMVTKE